MPCNTNQLKNKSLMLYFTTFKEELTEIKNLFRVCVRQAKSVFLFKYLRVSVFVSSNS